MKHKPIIKKPQQEDPETEVSKFQSGDTRRERSGTGRRKTDAMRYSASRRHGDKKEKNGGRRKETGRHGKSVRDEPATGVIKVKAAANGYCMVTAEGCMTIYEAARLKPLLLDTLQKHQHLEIDLSEVNEMDTAGMQLLLLLKRTAGRTGKSVSLVEHSPASLDVIDRYNLGGYFGDPVFIPSASS